MLNEPSQRVFCALDISPSAREAVARHSAALRSQTNARVGWEKPENLHITLKFLGEIDVAQVVAMQEAAARAALGVAPFRLALGGAGVFPPHGAPRVLWLGINCAGDALNVLQQRLEKECAALGFPPETHRFHPHLTLGRVRPPDGAHELARRHLDLTFAPVEFAVTELLVMRSALGPGGARYTTLAQIPLGR